MDYSVRKEDFPNIEEQWRSLLPQCTTNAIFLTPQWQRTWQQVFLNDRELLTLTVYCGKQLVGIAPLMREGNRLSLLGSSDVCDFLDFVIADGHGPAAAQALLDYFPSLEWDTLDLQPLLPSSTTLTHFVPLAKEKGYAVELTQMDVCPGVDLPPTWEEYLGLLAGKDRHELRRKMRRLSTKAQVDLRKADDISLLHEDMSAFLQLFNQSRDEKARFMTPQMVRFFWALATTMAEAGYLRLFFLVVDGDQVATAMGFDYQNSFYLYNSGYDPDHSSLGVGFLLKALCLKESIVTGKKRFEFLRGAEDYKYRLGGQDIPVYQALIRNKT